MTTTSGRARSPAGSPRRRTVAQGADTSNKPNTPNTPASAPTPESASAGKSASRSSGLDSNAAPSVHSVLGERLRRHRLEAGLTLTEVAERSGFGKAYLSRIENGQKVPPIASLVRICSGLGVEPATLLAESGQANEEPLSVPWRGISIVRHGDKRPTVLGGTAFGYNYLSVGATPGRALQAFVFSFPDQIDKYVFFEHAGEELLHVLSGTLEWQMGSDKFVVEAGDTVHFDSSIPHRGRSVGGPATALMVMYSPGQGNEELA